MLSISLNSEKRELKIALSVYKHLVPTALFSPSPCDLIVPKIIRESKMPAAAKKQTVTTHRRRGGQG